MQLLQKLLWDTKNKWQLLWAVLGAFIGLLLMLSALQVYFDIHNLLEGEQSGSKQYIIINKRVNLFNTLGVRSTFTPEEIDQIKAHTLVTEVGEFTPNRFKVSATSSMLGFYTELFFEALPDKFVDVKSDAFQWKEGQRELPVIISRDYLALYNFGFAPSQGLPQFTPSTIGRVSIDINVRGGKGKETFRGRIVGFSDRINSILVPLDFMDWANAKFGNLTKKASSRLILKTENAYSTNLTDFLEKNNYELSSGRMIGGQLGTVLNIILSILIFIGFTILLLSIIIFMLNFRLLVAQSKHDIQLLLQLGYKTETISGLLIRNLAMLFGCVLLASFLTLFGLKAAFSIWVSSQGFDLGMGIHWLVLLAAIGIGGLFYYLNTTAIKHSVNKLLV